MSEASPGEKPRLVRRSIGGRRAAAMRRANRKRMMAVRTCHKRNIPLSVARMTLVNQTKRFMLRLRARLGAHFRTRPLAPRCYPGQAPKLQWCLPAQAVDLAQDSFHGG